MERQNLIEILYMEFLKDKDTIKDNLLKVMNTITLEVGNKNEKITLIIKIEENKKEEKPLKRMT